jgi:AcrR family transcriptional regulator
VTRRSVPGRKPSRWAGLAPEDRRAERRHLLLDVAFELLGTEGWSGTTVRAICNGARLNPRYFYESFDDLDALIVAVYDRLVAELGDVVLSAIAEAGDDARAGTRAAIEAIVTFVDEDRRRARVLYVEALGNEALNRRRIEAGHQLVDLLERAAAERFGRPPEGERIGRLAAAFLVGGFGEVLRGWLDGRIAVPKAQLVDDASALFLAIGEATDRIATSRATRPPT